MKIFSFILFTTATIAIIWFAVTRLNQPSTTQEKPITDVVATKAPEEIVAVQPKQKAVEPTEAPAIEGTPIIDGIKERVAPITTKDETYQEEFVEAREKATMSDPTPLRPKQPFIEWSMQFSGSVAGAIASKNDKLYFGTYDYQAFIMNAQTGEMLFKASTPSQPINTTQVTKNLFLVPQRNGQVTAFQLTDGKIIWNHRSAVDTPNNPIDVSITGIAVFDNKFYISKHWGNLYIADVDTGVLAQDVGVTYESRIPAIKTKDGVLYSNVAGEIHCFKDNGESDWSHTIAKGYPIAMIRHESVLFLATTAKELIALNLNDRQTLWKIDLEGFAYDSFLIHNNTLFLQAKNLIALDQQTSKMLWEIKATSPEGFCRGAPVVVADSLYATEQNGRLIHASRKDGKIKKETTLNETIRSPITTNSNLLFIPTLQKRIHAINLDKFR